MNNSLQVHEETASNYFHRGNLLKQSGKFEEAAAAYQRCTELNPDFSWYHHNLGEVLAKLGQRDGAEKSYRRACELNPNSAWSWHNLGEVLEQQGNIDEAVAAYRKAVELYPDFYEFHNSLGKGLCLQGQLDESVSCLRQAIELDSESALPYQNLWEALARLGRVDEGMDCLRRAIELNPGEGDLYLKLAEAFQGKNEFAEAVGYYRKAIQLKPDFHWLYYKLGTALSAQGKWEEAIASYSKAAELEPGSAIVHHYLGHTLSIVQRWDEAIASYRKALDIVPNAAVIYQHLGDALATLQKWEQAVGAYRKSVEFDPNSLEAQDHLGFALYQLGRYDEAISAYRRALEIAPNSDVVHCHLGDALRGRAGVGPLQKEVDLDLDEAVKCYGRAIELNPSNLEAAQKAVEIKSDDSELYLQLGKALAEQGQLDGAIAQYSRVLAQNSDSWEAEYYLGKALVKQGRWDEAIGSYRRAIVIEPVSSKSYHCLADALLGKGAVEEAIVAYRKAIELNPDSSLTHNSLGDALAKLGRLNEATACYRRALELSPNSDAVRQQLEDTIRKMRSNYQTFPIISCSSDAVYDRWIGQNSPQPTELRRMAEAVVAFKYKPVISIAMPVHNTPIQFLKEAIESVLHQVYPYWELCIADDASTDPAIKETLEEYAAKDARIKTTFREQNGHISACSNSALALATGEFVAFVDHDDLLTPEALYEVALFLNRNPQADLIYSDEDKLNEKGERDSPFFKPDWCPDSLLSTMYIGHLGTYRRSLVNKIGGLRVGYEGSQDYDLVLRFTEETDKIFHIPKILYHWRIHPNSAASNLMAKPYAHDASQRALTESVSRRGEKGRAVQRHDFAGHYIIRYDIENYKLVSIIISTKNRGDVLDKCLKSIFENSTYPNYEVIVIDNGSFETNTAVVVAAWASKHPIPFKSYKLDVPFNYSQINNYAVTKAKGDYLLFLEDNLEIVTPDWIEAMVEQAQRPKIGAVGALLLYPNGLIEHGGMVLGIKDIVGYSHRGFASSHPGYFSQIIAQRNYSAVTGACLMCRREVFKQLGGFDEQLSIAYSDVDLCLKMIQHGYRNIYQPHVVLYHQNLNNWLDKNILEQQNRFQEEVEIIQKKWREIIENDPCYSPNLTREREDYSLRIG